MKPKKQSPPSKRGNIAEWLKWHRTRILSGAPTQPEVQVKESSNGEGFPLEPILKSMARQDVRAAIRDGLLEKKPCAICGCAGAEAHHEDYDKPLDVIWLCRSHHLEAHGCRVVNRHSIEAEISSASIPYSEIARRHGTSRQRVHQIAKAMGQGHRPKVYARQGGRFSSVGVAE